MSDGETVTLSVVLESNSFRRWHVFNLSFLEIEANNTNSHPNPVTEMIYRTFQGVVRA
jgi:hypothetical protein